MTLNQLRKLNRHLTIKGIANKSFIKYGKIITSYDFTELIAYMEKKTPIPEQGIIEVFGVKSLEKLGIISRVKDSFFGELNVQVGYCNGHNSRFNYLQYHRSSTIIIAVTDFILFLGKVQDIKDNQYEASRLEAFFIPEGVAVELYGNSLYSLPCSMESTGFRTATIAVKGTGLTLERNNEEDRLLYSKNKWIIAHEEAVGIIDIKKHVGVMGENLEISLLKK